MNTQEAITKPAVLVTGASSGIGNSTVLLLDQAGFQVFAGVRKQADMDALKQQASDHLTPVIIDVTHADTVTAAAEEIDKILKGQGLAALINNAGTFTGGPLEFQPLDKAQQQLEVNVIGLLRVTQAFLPLVRQAKGRIINVSSIMGRIAFPFTGIYNASKFAVEGLTDALRLELKSWNIPVTLIEPGVINTPFWHKVGNMDEVASNLPQNGQALYGDSYSAATEAYGKMGQAGISPEMVANIIHQALKADNPKIRYLVGRDAKALAAMATLVPDRLRDYLLLRQMG